MCLDLSRDYNVTTYVAKRCSSACVYLFLAGEKRSMHDRASLMIHAIRVSDKIYDTKEKLTIRVQDLEALRLRIFNEVFLYRTRITYKEYMLIMSSNYDRYFNIQSAMVYGLVND